MHFLHGGRVPLFPAVRWLDTASIVRGAQPIADPAGFHRVASISIPVSQDSSIEWHVALAARTTTSSDAVDGLLARLGRISQLARQFGLVKKPGLSIELRLLEDRQSIDFVHRDFYFFKPEFVFYLKAGRSDDFAWVWDALPTVLHELVHYRGTYVDMSYVDDEFSLVREEISASVAGYCGMFLGALSETDTLSVKHSVNADALPNGHVPLDLYQEYGPTIAGNIIAGQWVFDGYMEGDGADKAVVVVKKSQEEAFSRRCSEAFEAARFALVSQTATGLRIRRGKDEAVAVPVQGSAAAMSPR